jgi:hypothetical protein
MTIIAMIMLKKTRLPTIPPAIGPFGEGLELCDGAPEVDGTPVCELTGAVPSPGVTTK